MTLSHLQSSWLSNSLTQLPEIPPPVKDLDELLETIALCKTTNISNTVRKVDSFLTASLKDALNSSILSPIELLKIAFAGIFLKDEETAISCISRAKKELDFEYDLTGVHGRRTRHQAKTCLILVAKVLKSQEPSFSSDIDVKNIPLIDEDLIEDTAKHDGFVLGTSEAMILLAEALLLKHFQPTNDSDTEIILAYLARIINDGDTKIDFEIKLCSLYFRSIIQSKMNPKYLSRSCQQLEVLLDVLQHNPEFDPVRCLLMPTMYELRSSLAEIYCKQGQLIKSLEIFKDLSLFDEQVACLLHLGMVEDAKKLLGNLVEQDPTDITRWRHTCTLASLKKDPHLLEEVWNQSGNKFSPVAKLIGQHYYSLGVWDKSCTWLNAYLELSPIDSSAWFLLGCSSMRLELWDNAAQAFLRTTFSDPDNAQAWNNLAAVYSQKQRNLEALEAFMQAGKLDYDNLKIWQNILVVAEPLNDQWAIGLAKKRIAELTKNK
jgi:tetratricopeptide (TPR) repeat protein